MTEQVYICVPNEMALSWNDIYDSKHWSKRNEIAHVKHALVRGYLDPDDGPMQQRVDIFVLATFANNKNRIDPDNVAAKIYVDGLKPTLILNDDIRYVRYVTTGVEIGAENMVEIWLTPVGE